MHLSETELIDLLDGTLDAARSAHMERCAICRSQAEALRGTMMDLRGGPGVEPSPLFWNAFTTRVNAALDEPPRTAWPRWAAIAALSCAALLIVALLPERRGAIQPPESPVVASPADTAALAVDDLDLDGEWAVVRAAADELEYDDAVAQGLAAAPGVSEEIALELSDAERAELVRLIEREIERSGA